MAKSNEKSWVRNFIIGTFVSLYLIVSVISTIHVIDFFKLSNPNWLAISLALGFEVGAAASLASLIALEKMNRLVVWVLFFTLTAMQAMGNTYYAYTHLQDFTQWSELFGLIEEEVIYQKRVLSIISGAILPLVALGFIKSLVDYIRPSEEKGEEIDAIITQSLPEVSKNLPEVTTPSLDPGFSSESGSQDQGFNSPPVGKESEDPQTAQLEESKKRSLWYRFFNNDQSPERLS